MKDRSLLNKNLWVLETMFIVFNFIFMLVCLLLSAYVIILEWLKIILIISSLIMFLISCIVVLWIEHTNGYYICSICGCKHRPRFKYILLAMHIGRTRYLRCPACGKKSWNKKVY